MLSYKYVRIELQDESMKIQQGKIIIVSCSFPILVPQLLPFQEAFVPENVPGNFCSLFFLRRSSVSTVGTLFHCSQFLGTAALINFCSQELRSVPWNCSIRGNILLLTTPPPLLLLEFLWLGSWQESSNFGIHAAVLLDHLAEKNRIN